MLQNTTAEKDLGVLITSDLKAAGTTHGSIWEGKQNARIDEENVG